MWKISQRTVQKNVNKNVTKKQIQFRDKKTKEVKELNEINTDFFWKLDEN